MKKILLTALICLSQASFAEIKNSQNTARHQAVIEKAIRQKCGIMINLTELSQEVEIIHIDQGITDMIFTTVLSGEQREDETVFNDYKIFVQSEYTDMYDHNEKDWGAYSVTSLTCERK